MIPMNTRAFVNNVKIRKAKLSFSLCSSSKFLRHYHMDNRLTQPAGGGGAVHSLQTRQVKRKV